mgnify:CR=1 FL=1
MKNGQEYIEGGVDWKDVPVDTLVKVRDSEDEEWKLRYFIKFSEGADFPYKVWANGRTSKTTIGFFETWRYCELENI